jgi:hypothetical protein
MTYLEAKEADYTGAKITLNGKVYTVIDILSFEVYQDWSTKELQYYIEFKDENSVLRNWKSTIDGGTIEVNEIPFPKWAYKKGCTQ